jgi:DNA-binding NtrC family response regulator
MTAAVLVINRIGTVRKLTIRACRDLGFTEIEDTAQSGEALAKIRSSERDLLVILELSSPVFSEDDFELLRGVKRLCKAGKTISTILTCHGIDKNIIVQAFKLGVKNFIARTLDTRTFSSMLREELVKMDMLPADE